MSKSNNESLSGTHVDMWQPMSGRKSTIKDKWIGCNLKNHLVVDKSLRTILLIQLDPTGLGRKKRERERKREK